MLVLQVLQGSDRGKTLELPESEPQLIGRSSEALPITDTTVSRRHAELTPDDGAWYLRDLDSANGTFVNGQQIHERVRLSPGDQIRCGSMLFVFTITGSDPKRPSVIRMMDEDVLDVTVQHTADPNADSMILAAPDPVRAATDHLRVVYELTALTASTINREDLLDAVMTLIFEEFGPDRGFILLGRDPAGALEPAAVRYKVRPRTLDEGRIPVSRTIIQHTMERREGILSTNAMNDTRFQSGDSVRDYGIRSAICAPIVAGDEILGVIHIDSQMVNFTFTEQQMQLLSAIGQHTGLSLLTAGLVASRVETERLAAIGHTVASLSHSIKNILQGLRGGADAVELALNKGDVAMAKEGWPILTRNLDRILTLTSNMLAFSRQRQPEIELADLHALIEDVVTLVTPECDRKRLVLLLDLADDMPPMPIDANGIHQALTNIVVNAVDAAPVKKGSVTIKTAYAAAEQEATITVTDNGPGIDDATREHVFEAFTSTKGQRGTGLGLAVTKKIVEEHDGRIDLETAPGAGTTVRLILPTDRGGIDASETQLPTPMAGDHLDEF